MVTMIAATKVGVDGGRIYADAIVEVLEGLVLGDAKDLFGSEFGESVDELFDGGHGC